MIRTLVRQFLRRRKIGVWAIDSSEILNFENVLYGVLQRRGNLKYLQIGGNDGVMADPMFDFVMRHSNEVSGLVIEPLPHLFQALESNYRHFPSINVERIAIHHSQSEMDMYFVDQASVSRKTKHLAGIASFDPNHWERTGLVSSSQIRKQTVPCVPIMDLIDRHGLFDIDVLVTDTEGYDFHIIESLDLELVRPFVIRFEHGLPNQLMSIEEFSRISSKLNGFGYQVVRESYDATAILLDEFTQDART